VVFRFFIFLGRLPFFLVVFDLFLFLRFSSIIFEVVILVFQKKIEVVFRFYFFKIVFHFFLCRLSCWVKIRLHSENQLPGLSGSALKFSWSVDVGVVGFGPTKYFVTPNLS
jgi:hypothetical protein